MGKPDANIKALTQSLLSVFLVQSALSFTASTSLSVAVTNLGVNLRVAFFSKLLRQDIELLDGVKTGELTHQLSQVHFLRHLFFWRKLLL
jgi:ABC-type bacteriocin/lantibiotic exporter with double-glycine peptidase domain